jgi:competence protein ComEC
MVLIFASTFMLGGARYGQYTSVDPLDVSRIAAFRYVTAEGVVQADPEVRGRSARLAVAVNKVRVGRTWTPATGSVLVSQYITPEVTRLALPKYGDRVLFRGRITPPAEPTNPGDFSYRDYLARQRIYSVTYIRGRDELRVVGGGCRNPLVTLAGTIRDRVSTSLKRQMPSPESGIAAGMALGTYATLPDEIFDNFQRTGTLHLLAASGFNCAVIMLCAIYVFRRFRLLRRWAYSAAIPILILYMLVVGPKPSIVRATIMASLLALAYVFRRVSDPLNVLFAAALVILAWRPTDLFDVGFQLSFAAVLAIILAIPALQPWVKRISGSNISRPRSPVEKISRWAAGNVTEAVCATVAATLGTLPITAQYFNQVSLVSIPVNAAVAMLAPPVFVISLIAPATEVIPLVGQVVAFVDVALVRAMLLVVNDFGSLSWSSVSLTSPGPCGAAGYYVIVGAAIAHLSRQAHRPR